MEEETRRRIEDGLAGWDRPDSPERKRFEEFKAKLDKKFRHVTEAILASERLGSGDLQFIINTRP